MTDQIGIPTVDGEQSGLTTCITIFFSRIIAAKTNDKLHQ